MQGERQPELYHGISSFSFAVMESHEKAIFKIRCYLGFQFWRDQRSSWQEDMTASSRTKKPKAHIMNGNHTIERANSKWLLSSLSKPASSVVFSPTRPHLLHLPKQCHQPGTKYSDVRDCGGYFIQNNAITARPYLLRMEHKLFT